MERPSALSQDTKKISSPICLYNHFNAIFLIKKLFKIIYKKKRKKRLIFFCLVPWESVLGRTILNYSLLTYFYLHATSVSFIFVSFVSLFFCHFMKPILCIFISFLSLFFSYVQRPIFCIFSFFFLFVLLPCCNTYFYYILFFYSFILQISFCNILWLYLINNLYFFDNNFDEYLYSFICKKK